MNDIIYLEVWLNIPLQQSFLYKCNKNNFPNIMQGIRVRVPFGARTMTGFVVKIFTKIPENLGYPTEKIKEILKILDNELLFTTEQFELSLWMEHYYLCSRGEALSAMLPTAQRENQYEDISFEDDFNQSSQQLSEEQARAIKGICENKGIHYLYGPTGTGKTEVFLQSAEYMLTNNKGVIYLVPEIGLTAQIINSAKKRFKNTVAVLHSQLNSTQRLSEWRRILNREARIVIGARSAVFAPVPNLGLIIVDEEHDSSYKSGNSPRYSARQIAMHRTSKLNIPLVMGSATPSVESWHLMNTKKIQKYTLTKRLAGGAMPHMEVINLSETTTRGEADGCISLTLEKSMRETLKNKRQIILFLNRRGFTHFFRCNSCHYELTCKNCSCNLTYHKSLSLLRCHYCGWSMKQPTECPSCKSLDIHYSGFGTEYIEDEVRTKFPHARIQRIDTDSVHKKGELQKKFEEFRRGDIDILMGTQMVTKGLNFPLVQLVGIILADTGLHMPDFRAQERTFSLITQAAGRAGRFFPDGKVLIQSYNPERAAIAYACKNDIEGFYTKELEERKLLDFPPFSRLIRLVFRGRKKNIVQEITESAAKILGNFINTQFKMQAKPEILGPSECPLEKIALNYRWQILLRAKKISDIQTITRYLLTNYKPPSSIYIEVDVDPLSLL